MTARRALICLALLLLPAGSTWAHEKGALHLGQKTVASASNLDLRGERLPKNATITLQLRGTLETFPLGEVKTDAKGAFQRRLGLPPEARAGNYVVTAVASDGDKVAEAPLTIQLAATPDHDMAEHGARNTAPEAPASPHASAEMMPLAYSTGAGEWVAIVVVIGAGLAGGALLLRRPSGQ